MLWDFSFFLNIAILMYFIIVGADDFEGKRMTGA